MRRQAMWFVLLLVTAALAAACAGEPRIVEEIVEVPVIEEEIVKVEVDERPLL